MKNFEILKIQVPSEMVKIPLTTVLSDHNSHHSRNSFKPNNEDFDSDDELLESLKTTSIEKMKSSQVKIDSFYSLNCFKEYFVNQLLFFIMGY